MAAFMDRRRAMSNSLKLRTQLQSGVSRGNAPQAALDALNKNIEAERANPSKAWHDPVTGKSADTRQELRKLRGGQKRKTLGGSLGILGA